MDLSSIFLSIIVILACITPLFFLGRAVKKSQRKLLKPILDKAKEKNGKISLHEMTSDVCVAIDEGNNTLYYYRLTTEGNILKSIDLNMIQQGEMKVSRKKENDSSKSSITKLSIELYNNDSAVYEELIIFNEKDSLQFIPEFAYTDKWTRIINSKINPSIAAIY